VRIGVTIGDPAGIGPELVAAALADDPSDLVVFGDKHVLAQAARGPLPPFELVEVTQLEACTPGLPSDKTGRAQIEYLEAAVAASVNGRLDALVTAPIHKASAIAAGFAFPGHTELLEARLGAKNGVTMMFVGPRMKVSLATIHLSLAEVPRALTVGGLTRTILHTAAFLGHAGRIAVCGLNPHAGERGHFGDEEERIVRPAIEAAQKHTAARLTGPQVPDVVFRDHLDGKFDAVVALYHDQGLIPVKLVDFEDAVNCTLGLPIVRTSPDHGVAHDIAGRGVARTNSFFAALKLARRLARRPAGELATRR
jgi:4-hydroxythreonine-4-phosphate dehydrogenase